MKKRTRYSRVKVLTDRPTYDRAYYKANRKKILRQHRRSYRQKVANA